MMAGQPFEVMILIEMDHFKIAINGAHFTEFRYRIPLNRISHLSIDGDVSIASITFEGTSQPSYAAPTAPPPQFAGLPPYPTSGAPYQPVSSGYVPPPAPAYATGAAMYPSTHVAGPTYPTGGYPQSSYPAPGYPSTAYPVKMSNGFEIYLHI